MSRLNTSSPDKRFRPEGRERHRGKMSPQQLARMCQNVGNSLHAGVEIRRVWATEAERGAASHRGEMRKIRDRIDQGETLTAAMRAADGYFPSLLVEMVEVGETTGRLELVFFRLAEHYENVVRMRRVFAQGIAWPMLQLAAAIGVIGLFILIVGMVHSGTGPPAITVFGLYGPRGFTIYCTVVGGVAAAIAGLIYAVKMDWVNLDPLIVVAMRIPGLGNALQTFALSRLIWAFAMASDSEIAPDRVIDLSVRTTQNPYYTTHLDDMKRSVVAGGTLFDAFEQTRAYPDDFLDALETGEISGRISEAMNVLAGQYEQRAQGYLRTLTVISSVMIGLLVAGMIIYLIFSMALQYIGILKDLTP